MLFCAGIRTVALVCIRLWDMLRLTLGYVTLILGYVRCFSVEQAGESKAP